MEEQKLYFYECVMQCDLLYWAPNHMSPPERMFGFGDENLIQHPMRFYQRSADGLVPPDVLCVETPIAWFFTEAREKMVSRPLFNEDGSQRKGEREMKPKMTKVKFKLLAPEEVTEEVKKRAKLIKMRPQDTAEGLEKFEAEKKAEEIVKAVARAEEDAKTKKAATAQEKAVAKIVKEKEAAKAAAEAADIKAKAQEAAAAKTVVAVK